MDAYPFIDEVQLDSVSSRRRLPATLPVDGVSGVPGYLLAPLAGKMGSRLHDFRGSDFRAQYGAKTDYDESIITNLCGTDTYRESSSDFTWKGSVGLPAFAGSSRSEIRYVFDTEADPPELRLEESTLSTGDPLPGLPFVYSKIDSVNSGSHAVDVAGNKSRIGRFRLSALVTIAWLGQMLDQWLQQTPAFIDATGTPIDYDGSVVRSESDGGAQAVIRGGQVRVSAPIASPYDSGEIYQGFVGSYRAELRFDLRRNSPWVRDNEDSENSAADNAAYRSGSRTYTLEAEITGARFRDHYGIFDERTTAWEDQDLGWRVDHRPGAYVNADGEAELYAVAGVIQLLSADGAAYRVTMESGHLNYGDDPPSWVVDDTEVAEFSLGSPGLIRIKARPDDALHVTDDPEYPDLLLRVAKIERQISGGYEDLAVWPVAQGMVGLAPGPGVRILAVGKRRNGTRWGFQAFDGSLRYFRKKRLLKTAIAKASDA